jgi:hypothetical protein
LSFALKIQALDFRYIDRYEITTSPWVRKCTPSSCPLPNLILWTFLTVDFRNFNIWFTGDYIKSYNEFKLLVNIDKFFGLRQPTLSIILNFSGDAGIRSNVCLNFSS